MLEALIPVILCGGSGTRLWPLSRTNLPKQFMPFGASTLFDITVDRVLELGATKSIVISNSEQRFLVASILTEKQLDLKEHSLLLEPMPKNTAPAIALAAFKALEKHNDAIILVLPSDHILKPVAVLRDKIVKSLPHIHNHIITFGIKPDAPYTGYGYVEKGTAIEGDSLFAVKCFTEKPQLAKAETLFADGAVWNSGMFLMKAQVYLDELKAHRKDIYQASLAIWESRYEDLDFIRFDPDVFAKSPAESIDYAVMEHTKKGAVCPLDIEWSDLGSFEALYDVSPKDQEQNALIGDVIAVDTKHSYVQSTDSLVVALGMENVAIVETKDAILVSPLDRVQEVKKVIEIMKQNNRHEKDEHPVNHRPWGHYESIALGDRFQVKHITVKPKGVLSVQMHHHRSEHWIVVKGTALVMINDKQQILSEDESVYIPLGAKHRLSNPGCIPLQLVEIQTGSYLGEDDITRFEDIYGR